MKKSKIAIPCKKCPSKLGLIKFVQNPCQNCKANGHKLYHESLAKINPINPILDNKELKNKID
jgi:hypothetical protein